MWGTRLMATYIEGSIDIYLEIVGGKWIDLISQYFKHIKLM